MKPSKTFLIGAAILAFALSAYSQVPAAQPAGAKIGVFASDRFADPKDGITRLNTALKTIETEFTPKRQQISGMITRLETLSREINSAPSGTNNAAKFEQARSLEVDIKRQQEDARVAYTKRLAQLTDPVRVAVYNALAAFAKQRGIDILIDASKAPDSVFIVNPAAEITAAFIKDFNTKNP